VKLFEIGVVEVEKMELSTIANVNESVQANESASVSEIENKSLTV